ncbi:MAG: acylneuraminate cytidylyltransferase family protein [Silvibacterium sp.]|nr:acylneuraminate cytidylyltransferase family protein [Silvibacterium sp.]
MNSKRLPGKNTRKLRGVPLICWTLETALRAGIFDDVLVSSDDPEAVTLAKEWGASAPWLRPIQLASDTSTTASVLQHALANHEAQSGAFDAVVLLQPTSPFRTIRTIIGAVDTFLRQPAYDRRPVVSVMPIVHGHPAWSFYPDGDGMAPMLGWEALRTRSQDLCPAMTLNGLIYVFSAQQVRNGGPLIVEGTIPYLVDDAEESFEIDTPFQWRIAEMISEKRQLPRPMASLRERVSKA